MTAFADVIQSRPWLAAAFALPVLGIPLWLRLRIGTFRLSKQRTKRLFDLTRDRKWHDAAPIARQIAVFNAFRVTVDDRFIDIAMSRHNPMRMIGDFRLALGMIRLDPDCTGFVDGRRWRLLGFRGAARVLHVLSVVPWLAAIVLKSLSLASPGLLIGLAIVGLLYVLVFTWLATCMDAAWCLVHELDARYPPIAKASAAREARAESQPRTKTKRSPARRVGPPPKP